MVFLLVAILISLVLVLGICVAGVVLVRAVAKVVSEVGGLTASTARDVGGSVAEVVGKSVGEATRGIVETVAREVSKGIGDQLRGGVWTENEGIDSGVQAQAFVPWESWGEEEDGEGDVRWTPDPTDETMPDPEAMDNRNRTVGVPAGWGGPVEEMQGGAGGVGGPRVPNLSGERFKVE